MAVVGADCVSNLASNNLWFNVAAGFGSFWCLKLFSVICKESAAAANSKTCASTPRLTADVIVDLCWCWCVVDKGNSQLCDEEFDTLNFKGCYSVESDPRVVVYLRSPCMAVIGSVSAKCSLIPAKLSS